ncbi:MAG: transporter [Nitrospinae bacterium]|nr:transporter [Nitrospinota bacterium]
MDPVSRSFVKRRSWAIGACFVLLLLFVSEESPGAPITFNTALPVAEDEFIFREQFVFDRSGDDPSGANRDREVFSALSVLGYGVTSDFALFGVLPYVDKSLEVTSMGERQSRDTNGLGDVTLFGRYTVFIDNIPGRTFRIAPFAGVELPTGEDDATDRFGRLPASIQAGSGSVDPFAGVVATYQALDFQLDTSVSYKANTRANNFEFGDVAQFDASIQYRLWPSALESGVPGFLYGVLEGNLIHQNKNQSNGNKDPNSGGTTLFFAPGLQYVTKRWIAEGGVQIPVVQDLNGTALEEDYIVRFGFRFNF